METWNLQHPEHGLIEVHIGSASGLLEVDPGFPQDEEAPSVPVDEDVPHLKDIGLDGVERRVLITVEGHPVARLKTLKNVTVPLSAKTIENLKDGEFWDPVVVLAKPVLKLESNALDSWIRTIVFKDKGQPGVELDPPEGSKAAQRYEEMATSPWKRVLYPLGAGLGKSGWAIGVLLLGPIIVNFLKRIISWISERLPDLSIPWPDWSIPWPDINIPWPDWSLPSFDIPVWVEFLLQYSKVWIPILIGIVLGVAAVRRHRRSRAMKNNWVNDETQLSSQDHTLAPGISTADDLSTSTPDQGRETT